MIPFVMFTVPADTFALRINSVLAPVVLLVRMLKVVAPLIYEVAVPRNCTVLVPAVNVPLLFQLP